MEPRRTKKAIPKGYKGKPFQKPQDLTDLEAYCFDRLHEHPEASFQGIGRDLQPKRDRRTVRAAYARACEKLGVAMTSRASTIAKKLRESKQEERARIAATQPPPRAEITPQDIIDANPQDLAEGIVALSDPQVQSVKEAARAAGMGPSAVRALLRKLDESVAPVQRVVRDVRIDHLAKLCRDTSMRIVEHIDRSDIMAASLRDKAIAAGILMDKAQLLEGLPTANLAIQDHRTVENLVAMMVKEAQHRGMSIDVDGDGSVNVQREKLLMNLERVSDEEIADAELIP